jgi:hypothetical protein
VYYKLGETKKLRKTDIFLVFCSGRANRPWPRSSWTLGPDVPVPNCSRANAPGDNGQSAGRSCKIKGPLRPTQMNHGDMPPRRLGNGISKDPARVNALDNQRGVASLEDGWNHGKPDRLGLWGESAEEYRIQTEFFNSRCNNDCLLRPSQ